MQNKAKRCISSLLAALSLCILGANSCSHQPLSSDFLQYHPLVIASSLQDKNIETAYKLVLYGDFHYLFSFDTQVQIETLKNVVNGCFSTSPDGKWMAYCTFSQASPTGRWLVVESSDMQEQFRVPVDQNMRDFGAHLWLDNQRLILPLFRDIIELRPMVVINPFTGEQMELASEYPGLIRTVAGPAGSMYFNYSDVVYDPSLNLVLYQRIIDGHIYLVLWDREAKQAIARLENLAISPSYPLWSPDGDQLAVAIMTWADKVSERHIYDWYRIRRDGQVDRLTYFENHFDKSSIGAGSWSPDGRELAFWLEIEPSQCPGGQLAIMDIADRKIIDYCVPGSVVDSPPPIWSPDGRFIVVQNNLDQTSQVILVDLQEGWAARIAEYTFVAGWLEKR